MGPLFGAIMYYSQRVLYQLKTTPNKYKYVCYQFCTRDHPQSAKMSILFTMD